MPVVACSCKEDDQAWCFQDTRNHFGELMCVAVHTLAFAVEVQSFGTNRELQVVREATTIAEM